ncbi:hypothetical protein DAETH_11920 [Deinococcus aetherius]|uniref:Uncharacterized protein n=1 Tax=Deinococcus aetherius TaxID=200252 RepID=A0ABM8AC58_9DEIO|nr:hypothetical protein [Deinococcus aetherius]BDP41223.1 hypothetical protein DAETH_11920 [Deinococcus aetherius]
MPEYVMRIIKFPTPFRESNHQEVYDNEFLLKGTDPLTGDRLPDLSVSVYKVDAIDKCTLAKVLLQHSANIPLSSPSKNLTLVRVTDYIGGRSLVPSPLARTHFCYISDAHHEIKMRDKNDLDIFISSLITNYDSIECRVNIKDIDMYLGEVIEAKDLEWMKIARQGNCNGQKPRKLNGAWMKELPSGKSLRLFKDDAYCGEFLKQLPDAPEAMDVEADAS